MRPSDLEVAVRLAIMRQHLAAVVHNAHVHKDGRPALHLTSQGPSKARMCDRPEFLDIQGVLVYTKPLRCGHALARLVATLVRLSAPAVPVDVTHAVYLTFRPGKGSA